MGKATNLKRTVPSVFNPSGNRNWKALLDAFGASLDSAMQGIADAKEQLFVETAQGKFLEARGDNYGVRKFTEIFLSDENFRELIKILSFRPKQVRETIKDFLRLFFGDSEFVAIHEINPNELVVVIPATVPTIIDRLIGAHHFHAEGARLVKIDDVANQVTVNLEANFDDSDVLNDAIHTSDWVGSADISSIAVSDDNPIDTPGESISFNKSGISENFGQLTWTPNHTLDLSTYRWVSNWLKIPVLTNVTDVSMILSSTGASSTFSFDNTFLNANEWNYLNFDLTAPVSTTGGGVNLAAVTSIALRITLQSSANTLTSVKFDDVTAIRASTLFPADFFAGQKLRQNLKTFNIISSTAGKTNVVLTTTDGVDSDLPDLDKENKAFVIWDNWPGSFLYDPDGTMTFFFSSQTVLDQTITAGSFGGLTDFIDSSDIPNAPGFLVFDFGTDNEEGPVPYISRPDNSHLVIDPGYQFTKTHQPGAVTILVDNAGYEPQDDGSDYGVFNTSIQLPSDVAQEQLQRIVAAGVVIRFIIIEPQNHPLFG